MKNYVLSDSDVSDSKNPTAAFAGWTQLTWVFMPRLSRTTFAHCLALRLPNQILVALGRSRGHARHKMNFQKCEH